LEEGQQRNATHGRRRYKACQPPANVLNQLPYLLVRWDDEARGDGPRRDDQPTWGPSSCIRTLDPSRGLQHELTILKTEWGTLGEHEHGRPYQPLRVGRTHPHSHRAPERDQIRTENFRPREKPSPILPRESPFQGNRTPVATGSLNCCGLTRQTRDEGGSQRVACVAWAASQEWAGLSRRPRQPSVREAGQRSAGTPVGQTSVPAHHW
jgi:hypothetical protein